LTANVTLGSFVAVNVYSTIGHDASLADGCTLSGHCDVTGGATLREGVFMGSHAAVLPRIEVGAYARIGAGSIVTRRVAPASTAFGVPARTIHTRTLTSAE
jgi:serine acetyltransferase